MKILIINGSHRQGNTDIAIQEICNYLKDPDYQIRELKLRDIEMKLPDGCEHCSEAEICPNIQDEFSLEIEPTLHDYDIYIVATPTWSDNITPLTKIFWDRIVSWCSEDREYLKNKKLAIITHGMAGQSSWQNVINWIKSVCEWEQSKYAGSLTFKSGGKAGDLQLEKKDIDNFIKQLMK